MCHHRKALIALELLIAIPVVGVLNVGPASCRLVYMRNRTVVSVSKQSARLEIALYAHHDAFGKIPADWWEVTGKPITTGWISGILPLLEQSDPRPLVQSDSPEVFLLVS